MKQATLEIKNQIQIKWIGLDAKTRTKIQDKYKFFDASSRYTRSFQLGHWNGYRYLFNIGGHSYLAFALEQAAIVEECGYEIEVIDHRPDFKFNFPIIDSNYLVNQGIIWPTGHRFEGEPVTLMDHQVNAVNLYLKHQRGIQKIPTSGGKTLIAGALCKLTEPYGRSLTIVPNKDLVHQTSVDFEMLGLDFGVYFGEKKELGKTHTISTWQSLNVLDKSDKEYDNDVYDQILDNLVHVIQDECHLASGTVLTKLLCGTLADLPIRSGMTGTIPKDPYDASLLECSIGPVINRISAAELQEKGVLSNLNINIMKLKDNVKYSSFQSEKKYLGSDRDRLTWLAGLLEILSEQGNTLILFDNIQTGETLRDLIGDKFVFLSGKVKTADRREQYNSINDSDNTLTGATYGIASTGLNLPRIFNLVLFEPGKSFVKVIQSIGRGIRRAKDKDFVNVYDIGSNAKFSTKHLNERIDYYDGEGYPYQITMVDWQKK